jgi:hypothetical protein
MHRRRTTLALAAAVTIAVACYKDAAPLPTANTNTNTNTNTPAAPVNNNVTFTATMTGAKENPANTSTGTGTFTATIDTVTYILSYDITFSGLTSPVNNGHIHGPAAATVNAGTTINFNTQAGANFSFGLTSGTAHGIALLTAATQITATINGDSLKKLMFAGLTYANIHTTQNAGGEIRGQITKQ